MKFVDEWESDVCCPFCYSDTEIGLTKTARLFGIACSNCGKHIIINQKSTFFVEVKHKNGVELVGIERHPVFKNVWKCHKSYGGFFSSDPKETLKVELKWWARDYLWVLPEKTEIPTNWEFEICWEFYEELCREEAISWHELGNEVRMSGIFWKQKVYVGPSHDWLVDNNIVTLEQYRLGKHYWLWIDPQSRKVLKYG